jgi:N-acetylglucosaminyldiphosphoundecaprenol N-acetyl-beta-D-mannosaminyltransferase
MFGVPMDNLSMEETLNAVGELVVSGRQRHRTHQIATVNVDFVVNALGDRTIK